MSAIHQSREWARDVGGVTSKGGHNRRPPPLGLALEVSQERQELTFSERGVVGTSLLPPDLSLTAKVKPVLGRRERLNRQTLESFHR